METKELIELGFEFVGVAICNKRKRKQPLQIWINYDTGDMIIYDPKKMDAIYYEPMEERYQQ